MTKTALSLLALFLFATTCVVADSITSVPAAAGDPAGGLETFCQKAADISSCIELLKPAVTPTTDFHSLEWFRKVLSKSLSKAIVTRSFMIHARGLNPRQEIAVSSCVDKFTDSVELLQQVAREYVEYYKVRSERNYSYVLRRKNVETLINTATAGQEACYGSLDVAPDPDETMAQIKEMAGRALSANKIVSDLVLKN